MYLRMSKRSVLVAFILVSAMVIAGTAPAQAVASELEVRELIGEVSGREGTLVYVDAVPYHVGAATRILSEKGGTVGVSSLSILSKVKVVYYHDPAAREGLPAEAVEIRLMEERPE